MSFRYLLLVVTDVLDGHAILALIVASSLVGLGSPQCEVVAEQLHDEGGVLVGSLGQLVQAGDGLVEGGLGKLARGLLVLQDLIETDRIVQRQAKADGVGGLQDLGGTEKTQSEGLGSGNGQRADFFGSAQTSPWLRACRMCFVSYLGGDLLRLLVVVSGLLLVLAVSDELGEVAVVVSGHLEVEDACLVLLGVVLDEGVLEQVEHVEANVGQLRLDLLAVGEEEVVVLALVDAGVERAPRGAAGTDHVLVGDRQQVALLNGQLLGGRGRDHKLAHDLEEKKKEKGNNKETKRRQS